MMVAHDDFWLVGALSFVSASLLFAIDVAGLILAIRYRHVARISARLAATGFMVALLTTVGEIAIELTDLSGWTFYTPYSTTTEPSLWPLIAMSAASGLGMVVSAALILAALWTTWRKVTRIESQFATASGSREVITP